MQNEDVGFICIPQLMAMWLNIRMVNSLTKLSLKFLPLTLLLVLTMSAAHADVYGYADTDGAVYLTDNPTQTDSANSEYELLAVSPVEPLKAISVFDNAEAAATENKETIGSKALLYKDEVKVAALDSGVETALLHAVIIAESNYNARARSPKGAQGLMQLMPFTAKRFGVNNSYDPSQNIQGGARYLSYLLKLFKNDFSLAVAAYNAGEDAVIQHGNKIPPYRETVNYVGKVMGLYKKLRAG